MSSVCSRHIIHACLSRKAFQHVDPSTILSTNSNYAPTTQPTSITILNNTVARTTQKQYTKCGKLNHIVNTCLIQNCSGKVSAIANKCLQNETN
ncbi:hypothetical protein QL285_053958 [Trifolium repens]|nr:hypothetical protein QL285_053958 [Trifolium repens]